MSISESAKGSSIEVNEFGERRYHRVFLVNAHPDSDECRAVLPKIWSYYERNGAFDYGALLRTFVPEKIADGVWRVTAIYTTDGWKDRESTVASDVQPDVVVDDSPALITASMIH